MPETTPRRARGGSEGGGEDGFASFAVSAAAATTWGNFPSKKAARLARSGSPRKSSESREAVHSLRRKKRGLARAAQALNAAGAWWAQFTAASPKAARTAGTHTSATKRGDVPQRSRRAQIPEATIAECRA